MPTRVLIAYLLIALMLAAIAIAMLLARRARRREISLRGGRRRFRPR